MKQYGWTAHLRVVFTPATLVGVPIRGTDGCPLWHDATEQVNLPACVFKQMLRDARWDYSWYVAVETEPGKITLDLQLMNFYCDVWPAARFFALVKEAFDVDLRTLENQLWYESWEYEPNKGGGI